MSRKQGKANGLSRRMQATGRPTIKPCSGCGTPYNIAQSRSRLCERCRPVPEPRTYRADGKADPRSFGSPHRVSSVVRGGLPRQ